jgi:hypothetical protein
MRTGWTPRRWFQRMERILEFCFSAASLLLGSSVSLSFYIEMLPYLSPSISVTRMGHLYVADVHRPPQQFSICWRFYFLRLLVSMLTPFQTERLASSGRVVDTDEILPSYYCSEVGTIYCMDRFDNTLNYDRK